MFVSPGQNPPINPNIVPLKELALYLKKSIKYRSRGVNLGI